MNWQLAMDDLKTKDYFVWDDFLSSSEMVSVIDDYETLYADGKFKLAGTGNLPGKRSLDQNVRSDETYWLDPLRLSSSQQIFWEKLSELKKQINETFFLGLWTMEGHYSKYSEGGHYETHLDRFHSDDRRTISMVLYLNQNWIKSDAGELRFHFPESENKILDIEPIGGRLVCFLSDKVLHEVRPTKTTRRSFAAWWRRR